MSRRHSGAVLDDEGADPLVSHHQHVVGAADRERRAGTGHGDHTVGRSGVVPDVQARVCSAYLDLAPGEDIHHALLVHGAGVGVGKRRTHPAVGDGKKRLVAPHQQPAAVADGRGPAAAATELRIRTVVAARAVLDDLEARPFAVDPQRAHAALVAREMESRPEGVVTVEHPEQCSIQNLQDAVRAGIARHPDVSPFVGAPTGVAAVRGRDNHPGAGAVGRNATYGNPALSLTRHAEVKRFHQPAVPYLEHSGPVIADFDAVVGSRRGQRRPRADHPDGAVAGLVVADGNPSGPDIGAFLDRERAGAAVPDREPLRVQRGTRARDDHLARPARILADNDTVRSPHIGAALDDEPAIARGADLDAFHVRLDDAVLSYRHRAPADVTDADLLGVDGPRDAVPDDVRAVGHVHLDGVGAQAPVVQRHVGINANVAPRLEHQVQHCTTPGVEDRPVDDDVPVSVQSQGIGARRGLDVDRGVQRDVAALGVLAGLRGTHRHALASGKRGDKQTGVQPRAVAGADEGIANGEVHVASAGHDLDVVGIDEPLAAFARRRGGVRRVQDLERLEAGSLDEAAIPAIGTPASAEVSSNVREPFGEDHDLAPVSRCERIGRDARVRRDIGGLRARHLALAAHIATHQDFPSAGRARSVDPGAPEADLVPEESDLAARPGASSR